MRRDKIALLVKVVILGFVLAAPPSVLMADADPPAASCQGTPEGCPEEGHCHYSSGYQQSIGCRVQCFGLFDQSCLCYPNVGWADCSGPLLED